MEVVAGASERRTLLTFFLILGAFACLYLIWLLFRLAAFALPVYAGVALGLFMHANGYGYPSSILTGLAGAAALLVAAQFIIAFLPLFRWPVVALFCIPAGFAGYQTAGGLAGQAIDPGAWLSLLSWAGAFVAATGAWRGLLGGRIAGNGGGSVSHRRTAPEILQ